MKQKLSEYILVAFVALAVFGFWVALLAARGG